MKFAYLHSIDEAAFLGCLSAPTEELVECVAGHLARSDDRTAPWAADPRAWTIQRFAAARRPARRGGARFYLETLRDWWGNAEEIEGARQSAAEAVPVLQEMRTQGRMLFAPFEQ